MRTGDRPTLPLEVLRILWGAFFLAAAAFNTVVSIPSARAVIRSFADLSWPGAEELLREAVEPRAAAVIGLVVVFEAAVGAIILARGRTAALGLRLALAWLVALIPFLGVYALANVVLAPSLLPLLGRRFERSPWAALRRRPRLLRRTALLVQLVVGAGAVYGGLGLMRDGLGMPRAWLERTWFETWTVPGLLLLSLVAVPMLAAAWATWRRWPAWPDLTVLAGAMLTAWIVGQMALVPYFFLQPTFLVVGLVVAGLGLLARAGEGVRAATSPDAALAT